MNLFLENANYAKEAYQLIQDIKQLLFVGKVEKNYCYALGDFERLFYEGFSGKNDDCGTFCYYHQNRGDVV